ncbi:hypothetical protein LINPERHAP1_LOCUS31945, partial [Linum perenne]
LIKHLIYLLINLFLIEHFIFSYIIDFSPPSSIHPNLFDSKSGFLTSPSFNLVAVHCAENQMGRKRKHGSISHQFEVGESSQIIQRSAINTRQHGNCAHTTHELPCMPHI